MKKIITILMSLSLLFTTNTNSYAQNSNEELLQMTINAGYEVDPINLPKASILIDASSGEVLWANNPDSPRDPASTTKLITLYLVYEAIARGELTLDTKIVATKKDALTAKIHEISNNNIVEGVEYPVSELIKMVLVPSSNSATVMLANYLSNNDADKFIDDINAKAKELGMHNTYFYNPTGAVARAFGGYYAPTRYDNFAINTTTVRDMGILAYNFLKKYPEVLQYTKDKKIKAMANTPYEEEFKSYNNSLPGTKYEFEGVDGLKTGSSPSAGFNIVATAKRGEQRFIVVEMGVGDWSDQDGEYYRHPFINALFKKGFDEYERKTILPKGQHTINDTKIETTSDFVATVKKGTTPKFILEENKLVLNNDNELVSNNIEKQGVEYEKASFVDNVLDNIKEQDTVTLIIYMAIGATAILIISLIALFIRRNKN